MASLRTIEMEADGAVRLPADIRERMGVSAGSRMTLDLQDDGEVRLRPVPQSPDLTDKGGVLVVRGMAVGHLEAVERTERESRLFALGEPPSA